MSVLKYENMKAKRQGGTSYSGKQIQILASSVAESFKTYYFNPVSCNTGASIRADLHFSPTEKFNLNDVLLEFEIKNLDATLSMTIQNPFMLFSEIRLLLNNQEVIHLDSMNKIMNVVARSITKCRDAQELNTLLLSFMPQPGTSLSAPLNGCVIAPATSAFVSLPLLTILYPHLAEISTLSGIQVMSIEARFNPNYGTPQQIGQFMISSTTSNPYTDATIKFNNIACRLITTKHADQMLLMPPKDATIILHKYDERQYSLSNFNTVGSQLRVQLSSEFSAHKLCHSVLVYAYDTGSMTAYNSAANCKLYSSVSQFGFQLNFKGTTIQKFDTANQLGQRLKYFTDVYKNRNGMLPNPAFLTSADNTANLAPLTLIDLQSVDISDFAGVIDTHSGVSNITGTEMELIITNLNALSTTVSLFVVIGYYEVATLSTSGIVSFAK